jgi:beta-phosphoglucomutase-like phosphatase (HAD superfamily)
MQIYFESSPPKAIDFDLTLALTAGEDGISYHSRAQVIALEGAAKYFRLPSLGQITLEQVHQSAVDAREPTMQAGTEVVLEYAGLSEHPDRVKIARYIFESKNQAFSDMQPEIPPVEGVLDFLAMTAMYGVRGHRKPTTSNNWIVSNGQEKDIALWLEKHIEFDPYLPINHILTTQIEVVPSLRPKPKPDLYDYAARLAGVTSQDRRLMIVVEDDIRNMEAARDYRRFGITTQHSVEALANSQFPPEIAGTYEQLTEYYRNNPLPPKI